MRLWQFWIRSRALRQSRSNRDLAALKALILRGRDMDQKARAAALDALARPGRIFRPLAMEQQAVMALEAGDTSRAVEILLEVYQDSQSTNALRDRAQQIIVALGGDVPAITQLLSGQ